MIGPEELIDWLAQSDGQTTSMELPDMIEAYNIILRNYKESYPQNKKLKEMEEIEFEPFAEHQEAAIKEGCLFLLEL
jgi:hypothetical protein